MTVVEACARCAVSVVYIDVGQRSELFGEGFVAFFFLGMETQVLQQKDFTGFEFLGSLLHFGTYAVGHKLYRYTQYLRNVIHDVAQRVFVVYLAFGTTQVGHQNDAASVLEDLLDGGGGCADARVVGDVEVFVVGDVEVHANDGLATLEIEIVDGFHVMSIFFACQCFVEQYTHGYKVMK